MTDERDLLDEADGEEDLAAAADYDFGFIVRPGLRLSYVEAVLKSTRLIVPPFHRQTLIRLIKNGTLEGIQTRAGWLVYEDSFKAWARSCNHEKDRSVSASV